MYKPALVAGIISCGLAVALGAFGAHGLQKVVEARYIAVWEKGVTYQFNHGVAILLTGVLYSSFPVSALRIATILFLAGILLFSGSLYAITGLAAGGRTIGPAGVLTPIGGLCFIAGWGYLLAGVLTRK